MKSLLILVLCLITITAFTQTKSIQKTLPLSQSSASEAGMSDERLERIDAMCLEAISNNEIPGAVALVARNGKIVYHKAFGVANPESGRKYKRDDIFRIASQTKAITSTAVMMLWEESKFRLDDPISKYIPEFGKAKILDSFNAKDSTYTTRLAKQQITIRHLITHTSGIGYGFIDGDERFRKIYQKAGITDGFTTESISIKENIKKLAKLPLHHNPGEKFTYSEGLDVLGYFIEIISGMPLDEFFKTRIFDPLGMNDTWFYLPNSKASRLVPVQTQKDDKWIIYPTTPVYDPNYPINGAKTFFAGGAGLSSTVKDYATFLQMYLNKGELNGVRLLSRTTVNFMMENHVGDNFWDKGKHHGLAFAVLNSKGQAKGGEGSTGTFEWGGYFNTQYFADPQENIVAVFMKQTQEISNDNTGWKFKLLVGQAIDD